MIHKKIELQFDHRVLFTRGVFSTENPELAQLMAEGEAPSRALIFIDGGTASKNPDIIGQIEAYAAAHAASFSLVSPPITLPGGEACKNDFSHVAEIWKAIHHAGLDRHSYVLALGGGAILDLVGFAAATAHRGLRHVRLPTTTLSQGDGGVGVKNGVNYFGKKNWVGTFSVPHAIINDLDLLHSLPGHDRRAGIIEAIKVALIRDAGFFTSIEADAEALSQLDPKALEKVVRRSAELHVEHIATNGDPFEFGSARPLDFGHWAAHKLEQISDFRIGHGDAVAAGMAIDLLYSVEAGILPENTCRRILDVIRKVGFPLFHPELTEPDAAGQPAILRGLEEFREHLGGQLTITLVPEIGQMVEVNQMDHPKVIRALEKLQSL